MLEQIHQNGLIIASRAYAPADRLTDLTTSTYTYNLALDTETITYTLSGQDPFTRVLYRNLRRQLKLESLTVKPSWTRENTVEVPGLVPIFVHKQPIS